MRARPTEVTWGDAGVGTVGYLIAQDLGKRAGVRFTHVPYRALSQQIVDTMSGALSFSMTSWGTARGSDVRVLAVVADERQPVVPGVPTLKELGYDVNWRGFGGLMAPRDTPRPLMARLEAACLEAARDAGYQNFATSTGSIAPALNARDFSERLNVEYRSASTFLRELGLVAQ